MKHCQQRRLRSRQRGVQLLRILAAGKGGVRPAAAAAGSLAGIAYGEAGIPAQWRMCIPLRGEMDSLCAKMYAFCALYA